MSEIYFFKADQDLEHGRSGAKGNARSERPFQKNKWMHIRLRSKKAKGPFSFLKERNQGFILDLIGKTKRKYSIEVKHVANAGDHLHLQVRAQKREDFQNFLRILTTQIARYVTGAKKTKPFGKFWDGLAYSRVLATPLEALYLKGCIEANIIQTQKGSRARDEYLTKFRRRVASFEKRPQSQVGPSLWLVLQSMEPGTPVP